MRAGDVARADARLPDGRLFEFDFFLTDAMRFVPVKFCFENRTIRQPNGRVTFQFPPDAGSVFPIEAPAIAHGTTGGNDFDRSDFAEDLKLHSD